MRSHTPTGERVAPQVVCTNVAKTFSSAQTSLRAVEPLDLTLEAGTVTALVGPSGCGKSTLLRMIAGLEEPDPGGSVQIGGSTPKSVGARGELAIAFQDASLLPWRTTTQNVALAQKLARQPIDRKRIAALLQTVGLAGFENSRPSQLSGGMRQRAAIARCLVTEPVLLLLDEPFGAVDELTRRRLNIELPPLWSGTGTTTLLVTHSITEAVLLADRVLVMSPRPGRIIADISVKIERPRRMEHLHSGVFEALVSQIGQLLGIEDSDPAGLGESDVSEHVAEIREPGSSNARTSQV